MCTHAASWQCQIDHGVLSQLPCGKANIGNFAADTGSSRGNKFATVRFTWFDARDIVSQTCGLSQIPGSRAIPEILVSLYIHLPV